MPPKYDDEDKHCEDIVDVFYYIRWIYLVFVIETLEKLTSDEDRKCHKE